MLKTEKWSRFCRRRYKDLWRTTVYLVRARAGRLAFPQMGLGYFPILLTVLLIAIGAASMAQSLVADGDCSEPEIRNWNAYSLVIAWPIGFGFLLADLVLAPTMFPLIIGTAAGTPTGGNRRSTRVGADSNDRDALAHHLWLAAEISTFHAGRYFLLGTFRRLDDSHSHQFAWRKLIRCRDGEADFAQPGRIR